MTNVITSAAAIVAEINRRFSARKVEPRYGYVTQLPRLRCPDGFNVSVQASSTHYSSPRRDDGPYSKVECGYPSAPMPTLYQWSEVRYDYDDEAEEGSRHSDGAQVTDTVWPYVPITAVAEVIASHGGLLPEE